MGKLIGSLCILTGCTVLVASWMEHMKRRGQCMLEIIRFLGDWEYCLQIKKMRVPAFLETYPFAVPEFRLMMEDIRTGLLSHSYPTGQEVWRGALEKHKSALGLPEEACQILMRSADGFFGAGSRQAQQCIRTCIQMMESVSEQERKNYREKRKVYMPVGMLTGVMIVILLL